jgi:hypothetical protein
VVETVSHLESLSDIRNLTRLMKGN